MEKNTFNEKILNSNDNLQKSYSKTEESSWVSASVGSLLDKGAKVYPDISCSLRLGEPFIITLPETVRLDVDIHPLKNDPERFHTGKCVHIKASTWCSPPVT